MHMHMHMHIHMHIAHGMRTACVLQADIGAELRRVLRAVGVAPPAESPPAVHGAMVKARSSTHVCSKCSKCTIRTMLPSSIRQAYP